VAYDAQLAARVREMFADDLAVREQAMFGALAFLVDGRVAVAAGADGGLLVRVNAARAEQLLKTAAAQPIQMSGRTMRGFRRSFGRVAHSRVGGRILRRLTPAYDPAGDRATSHRSVVRARNQPPQTRPFPGPVERVFGPASATYLVSVTTTA
jgi:hypothetical protein